VHLVGFYYKNWSSSFIFVTQGNTLAPHSDHHHRQNIFLLLKGSCYTRQCGKNRI